MATDQSSDSVYAELLSNIRQVSLAVSLSSPSDGSTRVFVAADGCSLRLTHHGKLTTLQLPGKVALGNVLLPVHRRGSAGLSWRLPLAQPATSLDKDDASAAHGAAAGMWSAFDLVPGSEVRCRQCSTVLIKKDRIKAWKDLPSENWAEMMEFWHCHKPGSHPHHINSGHSVFAEVGKSSSEIGAQADEQSLALRAYGANSRVMAQRGVGFIDLITLLFEASDCDGVIFSRFSFDKGTRDLQGLLATEFSTDFDLRRPHAFCSSCRAPLGFFDPRTDAVTLWKYQILCQSTSSGPPPGISTSLSVTLTATIDRSGSAKSMLMPMPTEGVHPGSAAARAEARLAAHVEDVLSIWVLNPSIVYCSTAQKDANGVPAIRLLYKLVNREEAETMLEAVVCETQEINAPSEAIDAVIKQLDESNLLLPTTDRIFQGWKVGLLRR